MSIHIKAKLKSELSVSSAKNKKKCQNAGHGHWGSHVSRCSSIARTYRLNATL